MPARSSAKRVRGRISRERIVAAALRLVDAEGADALSMKRLADELGAGTMTLYGYFRSKDELLDAVVDAAVEAEGREPPLPADAPWDEWLRETVVFAHDALERHPGLARLRVGRPIVRPAALRFGERVMAILAGAGFAPGEAAAAFRLLFTYTFGFATLSPGRFGEQARREVASAVALLPPADYPALSAARDEFSAAAAGEEQFRYGLERILDGLRARAG